MRSATCGVSPACTAGGRGKIAISWPSGPTQARPLRGDLGSTIRKRAVPSSNPAELRDYTTIRPAGTVAIHLSSGYDFPGEMRTFVRTRECV